LQSTPAVFYGNIFIAAPPGSQYRNKKKQEKVRDSYIKRKSIRGMEFSLTAGEDMFSIFTL